MNAPRRRKFNLDERIVDRLRDLVSRYPKGVGLIKEYLQNADDARATVLRVYFDQRTHSGHLPDPEMRVALGSALVFVNDSRFTDEDLDHIQTISNSAKLRDAGRTGRFGQGFNTSYSVSDHPSLLTGDVVAWFDPHRWTQDQSQNAYAWDVREAAAHWPSWVGTFSVAGASLGAPFEGTAFRLPLRTPAAAIRSEIKNDQFTSADWEEIQQKVRLLGPALLVFLRSIVTLELIEVRESGEMRLRTRIRTVNEADVRRARRPLLEVVGGQPASLLRSWLESDEPLPKASFEHVFAIDRDDAPTAHETWEVVSELVRGPEDLLLREAIELCDQKEKVIPWAGAAHRRVGSSSSGTGGYACFLPLPDAGSAPVWLHGWFATDSARRAVASTAEGDDVSKRQVRWNGLLMEHAVGPAWATLVARLRGSAVENVRPYEAWPKDHKSGEMAVVLSRGFYRAVKDLAVFRVQGQTTGWATRENIWDIPEAWRERLEGLLRATGNAVTNPTLPAGVRAQLAEASGAVNHLTPELMRQGLRTEALRAASEWTLATAPSVWLTKEEWVFALAAYCSSDGVEKLDGLPLALLPQGRLRAFSKLDPIFLCSGDKRKFLSLAPRRALELAFQRSIFGDTAVPAIGVRTLDTEGLVSVGVEVLAGAQPSFDWLQLFFSLLEQAPPNEVSQRKEVIRRLAVVPAGNGNRHTMGHLSTPLVPGESRADLVRALTRIGTDFVSGPRGLIAAIEAFASRHSGFLWPASPAMVAALLASNATEERFKWTALDDPGVIAPLLDALATPDGVKAVQQRRDVFLKAPILPTLSKRRVAACESHVYAPTDFTAPRGVGGAVTIVDLGQAQRWKPLIVALGVPSLDGVAFVRNVLLPSFATATTSVQDELLVWLRDDFSRIEAGAQMETRKALRELVRRTAILPVAGGHLAEPFRVYSPEVEVGQLLGSLARKPDPSRFAKQRDLWARFFTALDLPRAPLAADLYQAVAQCIVEAAQAGAHAVRPRILQLVKHVTARWSTLRGEVVGPGLTFEAAVGQLAWLPARTLSSEDCAAALVPQDRLYKASELAAFRIRHLIGSILPILDGGDFPEEMALGLELCTSPRHRDVLAHFASLRAAPVPRAAKPLKAMRRSFVEVLRFLGSSRDGWTSPAQLLETPLVLVGRQWYRPTRVFLRPLPVSLPGAVCIQDDRELAQDLDASAVAGLQRLGVRDEPEPEDWLALLERLAGEHRDAILPEHELRVARGALHILRSQPSEWLSTRDVWILTGSGMLSRASTAFIPDDPRLRSGLVAELQLVEGVQEIMDLARRAGARSLRASLRDQLHDTETFESVDAGHRAWCSLHERRVRSRHFGEALRRIAYDAALRDGEEDALATIDEERLGRSRQFRLKIAESLRVQSLLENGTVVFDFSPASFVSGETSVLWLNSGPQRKVFDELVRAIARICDIADTLLLGRLLELDVAQMHAMLDEDGVACVPSGRELRVEDLAAHASLVDSEEVEAADGWTTDEPSVQEEGESIDDLDGTAGDPGEVDASEAPEATTGNGPRSGRGSSGRRWNSAGASGMSGNAANTVASAEAGRELSQGSSDPWTPGQSRARGTGRSGGGRPRTYLHAGPQSDYDTGPLDGMNAEVAEKAIGLVREWEDEHGRTVLGDADGTLEAFNLTSEGTEGVRHIRVIGIDGPWTGFGVGLQRRHFDIGQQLGTAWWLYVVEHVLDASRATVHAIHDPARLASEFRFDSEWRAVAEGSAWEAPPHVGENVQLEDGRTGSIVEVEGADGLYDVVIRLDDGQQHEGVWRPVWRKVRQDG